ncbi:hypothetical protein EYZ11_007098 [Aspergillus tanneri]|uniref:Uncharacterized protein n=1 Tax=Aspergillus tanneri TaxID=1220188 RepID=A0A4S3JDV3_9EURO|nr:hypothetical protein EYZ11_007098 [Aspergillus tanneri]
MKAMDANGPGPAVLEKSVRRIRGMMAPPIEILPCIYLKRSEGATSVKPIAKHGHGDCGDDGGSKNSGTISIEERAYLHAQE